MIEVNSYRTSLKADVIELIQQDHFKTLIWDWQFNLAGEYAPLVATENNTVIGFNGVMPISIWNNNEAQPGIWSCDFYVSKTTRGKGVGRLIKDKLIETGPRFIMSLGVSDNALPLLLSKGWQSVSGVRVYRRRIKNIRFIQFPYLIVQVAHKILYCNATKANINVELQNTLPASEQLDSLWQEVKAGYNACVTRDSAYLTWRYAMHPLGQYKYCVAKTADGLAAVLVYKIEANILRIVDYLGPAQSIAIKKSLLKKLLGRLEKSVKSISFTVSDAQWHKVLYSFGFYRARQDERFVVLDKNQPTEPLNWFITGGDSDGDIIQTAIYSMQALKQGNNNE